MLAPSGQCFFFFFRAFAKLGRRQACGQIRLEPAQDSLNVWRRSPTGSRCPRQQETPRSAWGDVLTLRDTASNVTPDGAGCGQAGLHTRTSIRSMEEQRRRLHRCCTRRKAADYGRTAPPVPTITRAAQGEVRLSRNKGCRTSTAPCRVRTSRHSVTHPPSGKHAAPRGKGTAAPARRCGRRASSSRARSQLASEKGNSLGGIQAPVKVAIVKRDIESEGDGWRRRPLPRAARGEGIKDVPSADQKDIARRLQRERSR